MATLGEDIRVYLKTKAAITAVVGSGADAKIFLYTVRQDRDPPYIVIDDFGGGSEEHLAGVSGIGSGRLQIDCYATTPAAAKSLSELVRLAPLQMYRGTAGSSTLRTVSSNGGSRSGFDNPAPGSDQKRYWTSRDYIIHFSEATS